MKAALFQSSVKIGGALAFAGMAAFGWLLEAHRMGGNSGSSSTDPVALMPGRRTKPQGTPEDVIRKVRAIRNLQDPVERMRATIALARSLSPGEIERWLDHGWFTFHSGPELIVFTNLVRERWTNADPASYTRWSIANQISLAGGAWADWARKDPQAALSFLKDQPIGSLIQLLSNAAEKEPALALEAYRNLLSRGVTAGTQNYSLSFFQQLVKKDPAALEGLLSSLPPALQTQAEMALAGPKLATSFSTEIRKLWERPDGWQIFQGSMGYDPKTGEKLLSELKNLPSSWRASLISYGYGVTTNNALQWYQADLDGAGFSATQCRQLRSNAIQTLSNQNPGQAIDLIKSGDFSDQERKGLMANLISMLSSYPDKTEAALAKLDPGEERQQAQTMLDQYAALRSTPKTNNPSDWLEKVTATDVPRGAGYSLVYALREWGPDELGQLRESFQTLPDDNRKKVAEALVSGNGSYSDMGLRGDAISYLLNHPDDPAQPGTRRNRTFRSPDLQLASQYAVDLGRKDPASAGSWVQSLPSGEAQNWAQKNLASTWAQYDPDAAGRWVQSLPAGNRAEVQKYLDNGSKP
ncbi:MAG: hypothetical protein JWO82_580 [Akkermansiaceae bacterium]|nr:hypothetical protein [Akkermansiaceae bacterium]